MGRSVKRKIIQLFKESSARARFEPIWFAKRILGIKQLDPWQIEALEAVCDIDRVQQDLPTKYNHEGKNYITIRAGHGPGKTFIAAVLMHWWQYTRMGRVVCTAPKERQLTTRLFPEFSMLRSNAAVIGYDSIMHVDALKCYWGGNKNYFAVGETANEAETLAGYHHDYLMFIVEEASGVKEQLFPAIEGAVSTGIIPVLILIGNPTRNIGTFYSSHRVPEVSQDYYTIHASLDKTTRVDAKWVDKMIRKYGANSPVVKIRCYGYFADSDPDQLISMQWVEDAKNDARMSDGSIPTWRLSIDVSDGGEDETVFTLAQQFETFLLIRRCIRRSYERVMATKEAADDAIEVLNGFNLDPDQIDFIVDSLGVGAGVRDQLLSRGHRVIGFKGGASSSNKKRWRNKRVQCYWAMHNALKDSRIVYADDCFVSSDDEIDYEAQLSSIQMKHSIDRIEDVKTKEEMKRSGIKSPDMADSSMMLFSDADVVIINDSFGETFGAVGKSDSEGYYDAVN